MFNIFISMSPRPEWQIWLEMYQMKRFIAIYETVTCVYVLLLSSQLYTHLSLSYYDKTCLHSLSPCLKKLLTFMQNSN